MKFLKFFFLVIILSSCTQSLTTSATSVGNYVTSAFGLGVSIKSDPRSPGLYIDDKISENLITAKIIKNDYRQFFINVKVIDGTAFLSGKVEQAEDKLKITKIAWETSGIKAVKNDIVIIDQTSFKQSAKDALIGSQLYVALLVNKNIGSSNYNFDVINGKVYIYGMASDKNEFDEVIKEVKLIPNVEEVVSSIILATDLTRQHYL